MWVYIWFFVALCLGVCCWYWHREYKYYKFKYSNLYGKYVETKRYAEKLNLLKKLLSFLRNTHPENVEISSVSGEIYDAPYLGYVMYGDGKIIVDNYGGGKTTILPTSERHLIPFVHGASDISWLYIELYRDLVQYRKGDR